jgi:hypothetical protein
MPLKDLIKHVTIMKGLGAFQYNFLIFLNFDIVVGLTFLLTLVGIIVLPFFQICKHSKEEVNSKRKNKNPFLFDSF